MARLLSVSVPDALAAETEALALASGRTKSEVVRDALRLHLRLERLMALQRFGRERAETLGIDPGEIEALVDDVRSARG